MQDLEADVNAIEAEEGLEIVPKRSKWLASPGDDDDEEEEEEEEESRAKLLSKKKKKKRKAVTLHDPVEEERNENEDDVAMLAPESIRYDPYELSEFLKHQTYIERCHSVDDYEKLNRIDEGAYGIVYRARERKTGHIVALKKMKLDREKHGFPVTALREIFTLLACKHPHIVNVREIVMGSSLTSVFIVMDFLEHDLKSLLTSMPHPFTASEMKTLLRQILEAVGYLHTHWILHRDLKTSNLLMNNLGEIKVADFGLARRYSDPLPRPLTQLVVTLWYRAPELLLGAPHYTSAIDLWSVGCIFAEVVLREPLFPGQGELDQLDRIFKLLGRPPEHLKSLPQAKNINFQRFPEHSSLNSKFGMLTHLGRDLLAKLLALDPGKRISAQEALLHPYFKEHPPPKDPSMFPTFPSKASGEIKKHESPSAPKADHGEVEEYSKAMDAPSKPFQLRFA